VERTIEVSLDAQGHILIPASVAGSLGLAPGMTLVAEEEQDGDLRLRVESEVPVLVDKGGVLVVRAEPLGDLADFARGERERRVKELVERITR